MLHSALPRLSVIWQSSRSISDRLRLQDIIVYVQQETIVHSGDLDC